MLLIDATPAILWLLVATTGGLGGAYALARAGRPAARFLAKPFTRQELLAALGR